METDSNLILKDTEQITGVSENLIAKFQRVRKITEELCKPLRIEDYVVQPVVDVSPPKWHLAHTTWFFEELVLTKFKNEYRVFDKNYGYLFNSYYESVGERVLRPHRGFLTRPTVKEIYAFRKYVDDHMLEFLSGKKLDNAIRMLIELGLNHEQQHQELLITDLKYILGHNPLFPVYLEKNRSHKQDANNGFTYLEIGKGIYDIGHRRADFCYDNELGRHKVYLHAFKAMDRLVTNGEYLGFMQDGGYHDFRWWFLEAWDWVNQLETKAPMYWHNIEGKWHNYTLSGLRVVDPDEPVTHVSMFEAEAFAQWKGKRLLTEFEWEALANNYPGAATDAGFVDNRVFHPEARSGSSNQLLGETWEWTNSAYLPYPFYSKAEGAVGEYNGKFMINQMVLRGGSCATSKDHIRLTYRNFFHPHLRWQFTGIRLAENL